MNEVKRIDQYHQSESGGQGKERLWQDAKSLDNPDLDNKKREQTIRELEQALAKEVNLDTDTINGVLNNITDSLTRQKIISSIENKFSLKGRLWMKDVSGTWLEVKIDSPAIQKDKLHGWIIKYTVLAKRETDSQGHMIIVNFNGRDGKMPKRINYINTFIRYKNESQMQDGKMEAAA